MGRRACPLSPPPGPVLSGPTVRRGLGPLPSPCSEASPQRLLPSLHLRPPALQFLLPASEHFNVHTPFQLIIIMVMKMIMTVIAKNIFSRPASPSSCSRLPSPPHQRIPWQGCRVSGLRPPPSSTSCSTGTVLSCTVTRPPPRFSLPALRPVLSWLPSRRSGPPILSLMFRRLWSFSDA